MSGMTEQEKLKSRSEQAIVDVLNAYGIAVSPQLLRACYEIYGTAYRDALPRVPPSFRGKRTGSEAERIAYVFDALARLRSIERDKVDWAAGEAYMDSLAALRILELAGVLP